MNEQLNVTQQLPLPPGVLTREFPCGASFDINEKSKRVFSVRKNNKVLTAYVKTDQENYAKLCAQRYNNFARYKDLYPGVDFHCRSFQKEFAYKMVINEPGVTEFPLLLQMENICLKRVEKDHCTLFMASGTDETVFSMKDSLIVDDGGEICPTVKYLIEETLDGMLLTVKPNQAWLRAKKRSYPLVIYTQILYTDRLPSPVTHFENISALELHFPIGIQHQFMPDFTENGDYDMQTGTGWRLSIMQSVTPCLNEHGDVIGYNYLDGEGKNRILDHIPGKRDRTGSPSETIGKLNVYYSYQCDLDGAYDEDLHTYHNVFPFHIKYDPELRVLYRDALHHYFDKDGRLIRIANDRRITLNIEIKKGRIYSVSNHNQKFCFAYRGKKLAAIIAPNHDRIDYNYDGDRLAEVEFSNGKKYNFSTPS